MDLKEKELFDNLYKKLVDSTFEESDVYQLMIMLRDHSKKGTLIYEIGSLVAHRKRNRGIVLDALQEISNNTINNNIVPLESNHVFGFDSFKKEINDILNRYDKKSLSDKTVNELLLFIASLMQFSKYVPNGNHNGIFCIHFIIAPSTNEEMLITLSSQGKYQTAYSLIEIKDRGYFKNDVSYYKDSLSQLLKELRSSPITVTRNSEKKIEIYFKDEQL